MKKIHLLISLTTIILMSISLMSCNSTKENAGERVRTQTSTAEVTPTPEASRPESTPTVEITPTIPENDQPEHKDLYEGVDPSNQRVTFWHPFTGVRETALIEIIDEFNNSNEWGIDVVAEYQGDFVELHQKMLTFMNTEEAPNLILTKGSQAGMYQLGEALIDINPLVAHEQWGLEASNRADIFPGFYEQGIFPSFGSARLSFPMFGTMNVLYYNADWLTELGFDDPPESPEIFQQAACAASGQPFSSATANGRVGYQVNPDAAVFADWTLAFGSKLFDYGVNQYSFDDNNTTTAMTYLQDLVKSDCIIPSSTPEEKLENFSQGVLLFSIDSIEKIPAYRTAVQKEANFNWRIAPIPHTTNNPAANVQAINASITETTPVEQLASWLFLKYFTKPEIQAEWVQATDTLSIRSGTATSLQEYFTSSPAYQMTFDILRHSVYEPVIPGYDQVREKYQVVLQAIIEGTNVTDTLAELNRDANLLLEDQLALIPESPDAWVDIDPNGQTITFWHQHIDERQVLLEDIINEFNITNQWGITVIPENMGSYGDIFTSLLPILGTDEVPNLVVAYQHHAAAYQLVKGLVDLNSLVDSTTWGIDSPEKTDFFPGIYSQDIFPIFDGARLGYPIQRSTDVLYYNANWLSELGFSSPPATPEEFKQMACAVTSPFSTSPADKGLGYQFYVDSTRFSSWVFAFGGDIFDEETNKFTYDNATTTQTVNYLLDLIDTGCTTTVLQRDEVHTAFSEGTTLFMVDSSLHIPTIDTMVKESGDFEWNVAPIPSTKDEPVQNVFGASISIPTSTPEKELAAWLFLKYFTSPEVQAQWGEGSNYLPIRMSAGDYLANYFSDHSQIRKAFGFLNYGVTEPSVPGYDFVGQEVELALEAILEGGNVAAILSSLTVTANQVLTVHLER